MNFCSICLFMIRDKGQMHKTIFLFYQQSFRYLKPSQSGCSPPSTEQFIFPWQRVLTPDSLALSFITTFHTWLPTKSLLSGGHRLRNPHTSRKPPIPAWTRLNECYCPLTRLHCALQQWTKGVSSESAGVGITRTKLYRVTIRGRVEAQLTTNQT